jgi:hypothetical protein
MQKYINVCVRECVRVCFNNMLYLLYLYVVRINVLFQIYKLKGISLELV